MPSAPPPPQSLFPLPSSGRIYLAGRTAGAAFFALQAAESRASALAREWNNAWGDSDVLVAEVRAHGVNDPWLSSLPEIVA